MLQTNQRISLTVIIIGWKRC